MTRISRRRVLGAVSLAVCALTLVLAAPAGAADMQKYLSDTQDLVKKGDYEKALERFVWFHDHALEHEPAMYGVRLSFALSYWKSLGDSYPPALEAMVAMRDKKTARVLEAPGRRDLFHDVVSLNRVLGEDEKSIELFEAVRAADPKAAALCWDIVKEPVFAAKRYDLMKEYVRNPTEEFARIHGLYLLTTGLYKGEADRPELKKYNEDHFVEQCLQLIEVAVALDNLPSAKEIQAKALAVVDDERLRNALGPTGN